MVGLKFHDKKKRQNQMMHQLDVTSQNETFQLELELELVLNLMNLQTKLLQRSTIRSANFVRLLPMLIV